MAPRSPLIEWKAISLTPRPHPSSLESTRTNAKTNPNDSFLAYMPLPPPYSRSPRNGRACLPRGPRVEIRQKPAPRIGVQQQAKTKPLPATSVASPAICPTRPPLFIAIHPAPAGPWAPRGVPCMAVRSRRSPRGKTRSSSIWGQL